ncbi:MAG: hypothetical protein WC804_11295 [Sphingomonas sp.]|jgi:hypothetical protein|uniref:hypothetical protein n=1 Tax=Sphingomonas sp. TaxID=28214 RepID=UPI00356195EA
MTADDLDAEVRALIGQAQYVSPPGMPANAVNVRAMCAAVENGNPAYWDGDACPATLLPAWGRPELWEPGEEASPIALQAHFDLKERLGYPASIVVSYTTSFYRRVRIGDRLGTRQVVRQIGSVKTTRLGTGRFWTVEMQYLDEVGRMTGIERYEFFGYAKAGT